jgi:hypothetical protein
MFLWKKNRPFNWRQWASIANSVPSGSKELERWHLWNLHSQTAVEKLACWLSESASEKWKSTSFVSVQSSWVDCLPIAKFGLVNPPNPVQVQQCELGDLLLIVESSRNRTSTSSQRALLLQAKCVDHNRALDCVTTAFPGPPKSSTHKQRNLYESHIGPFDVNDSAKAGASSIGSNPYVLSPVAPLIRKYCRYLLIPRTPISIFGWQRWPNDLPYQTLKPTSRGDMDGGCVHLADLALSMAELTPASNRPIGERIDLVSDWRRLVLDLLTFTKARTVGRFKSSRSAHYGASYQYSKVKSSLFDSFGSRVGAWMLGWEKLFQLHVIPPGRSGPNHPEIPKEGGMLVLWVRVSDSDGPLSEFSTPAEL